MNEGQKRALRNLKTAKGQLDKVISMLEDERYCIDVANQILAVSGLLKKANMEILEQHINHCVRSAFEEGGGEAKVEEVMKVVNRLVEK